jgi:AraC-like DNA-binding protein
VCYKTGFKDQSYFTKSFKNHFNQNPTEFIKSFLKAQ